MTSIGFVGVGAMGGPMAANLVKAGFDVCVHDIDAARAQATADSLGCARASGLADVAARDVVITMLPDGEVVAAVLLDDAFLAAASPGLVVVDMSSSQPPITRETGAALKARGVALVDAPVSGGVPRAVTGELAIMIGADDADAVAKARPALEALGKTLFEVGPLGAGHAMKALNNFTAAATFAAASEALAVGEAFGLAPETMIAVMNASTGRSFITEVAMKDHVLTGRFASGFSVGLLAKDVGIAAELAEAAGAPAPLAALVRDRWAEARDALGPTRDNTEAFLAWRRPQGDSDMTDPKTSDARAAGLARRRRMFGPAGAERAVESASDFKRPLEDIVTEFCFGTIWDRPGLDDRTRSMLTIAVLTALGHTAPLKNHVKGAIANGVSAEEIREVILHTLVYAGLPAGVEATRVAEETLAEMG